MHIVIAHNAVDSTASLDELDVTEQVEAVQSALGRLGHQTSVVPVDLDLAAVRDQVTKVKPDLIFNLVESLAGTGRMIHFFPALLETLGLPYTGASAQGLFFTSNKLIAKRRLHDAGVPTPLWVDGRNGGRHRLPDRHVWPHQWIVKSLWEHASIGLDETAIIQGDQTIRLPALLEQRAPLLGGDCFAEAYIEGREFNLSVLDSCRGPQVLPAAEIVFEGYHENQPHIVDYRAKWDSSSYAYHHTPRRFDFDKEDEPLLRELENLAKTCWDLFELRGYARVDFRVDQEKRPWVLEINANPCISPDAGFAAAMVQCGLSYEQAVERIVLASCPGTARN